MPTQDQRTYRKSLGLVELVCLGVGGTIGSGIFVVPGLAAQLAGTSSLIAWMIVALSACAVAFALGSLHEHSPLGTSFIDLFARTFGGPVAVFIMLTYGMSSIFGVATVAAGLGQYLSYFGMANIKTIEVSIVAAFLAVNVAGIAFASSTETFLSVIKILGILAIVALLAPRVHLHSLIPMHLAPLPRLLQVVIIVYWPFTGFELSAIPVGEMKDPRVIRRALLMVMVLVCAIYLGLNLALLGAVGAPELAASPAPMADAVGLVIKGSAPWVALLAIVTMLSALNAYIVGASRSLHDVFRMPQLKGRIQLSVRGTPILALLIVCVGAAALLMFSNRFEALAVVAVLTTLVPYVALCVAAHSKATTVPSKVITLFGAVMTTAVLILYFALH